MKVSLSLLLTPTCVFHAVPVGDAVAFISEDVPLKK